MPPGAAENTGLVTLRLAGVQDFKVPPILANTAGVKDHCQPHVRQT